MPNYEVPDRGEREAGAAAGGNVFFFVLGSSMNSWLMGNYRSSRIFVIAFQSDFTIRIVLNRRAFPTMILDRLAVRKQASDWAGAAQKRFARAVGWCLAAVMLCLVQKVGAFRATIVVLFVAAIGPVSYFWFPVSREDGGRGHAAGAPAGVKGDWPLNDVQTVLSWKL